MHDAMHDAMYNASERAGARVVDHLHEHLEHLSRLTIPGPELREDLPSQVPIAEICLLL